VPDDVTPQAEQAARERVGRLAGLRSLDRSPAVVQAVRRARRVLPGDPGFGDPLSAAGQTGASRVARVAERVFDDEPRASRELGLTALQLWQSVLERSGRGRGEVDVTILFTDLVGFSSWALQAGDEAALQLLRRVAAATEPPVVEHRGKVVKRLGDGIMAVFPTPQQAFDAVTAARVRLREVELDGHRPLLRAGLHTGRPRAIGGDYLGVDVTVAARLVELAGTDEVLVSSTTLAGLDPARTESRRKKSLLFRTVKGVPDGVDIYAVGPRPGAAA
jgi:adenylate cyclase